MRRGSLLALALLGCSTQTQLVVVVETNLEVPRELDAVEVAVLNPDGVSTVTPQPLDGPDAPAFPLTLGVVPGGDALGPITVTVTGRLRGAEVVRQRATVTLVAGETRVLHLVLYRSCIGRACDAEGTCDAAGCVDLERTDLPAWTGTPPRYDDSDPCLALPWDVDGDGDGSRTCGGSDCDDDEPMASATRTEDCDRIDNDCDEMIDEGCDCAPLDLMEDCTTRCGSPGTRTCTAMGWTECMPGAEACNVVDDDCDGAIDEGFAYAPSAPVALTGRERASLDPDLIWTGDRYALVWYGDTDDDGVHFQTLDVAGTPMMTTARRITDHGRTPGIAWSGRTYGVAYWHRETVSCGVDCTQVADRVRFVVIGPDGATLAGPEQIEADADNEPRPKVVWNGTAFVVGYPDGELLLDPRGEDAARSSARIVVPTMRDGAFDLVFTGGRFALAYSAGDEVFFTQGDLAAFPPTDQVAGTFDRPETPSLIFTGDGFLLALESRARFLGDGTIQLVALDAGGASRGMPIQLSTMGTRGSLFDLESPPAMAMGAGHAAVIWDEMGAMTQVLRFARVAPDGTVVQAPMEIPGLGGAAGQSTVAWSGSSYGVVWVEDPSIGDPQLVFSRLGCP